MQVGVAPVPPPKAMAIMFGYGFQSEATPDRIDRSAAPYRHPQSFYFSGYPLPPPDGPDAPFVSQKLYGLRDDQARPESDVGSGERSRSEDAAGVPAFRSAEPRGRPRRSASRRRGRRRGVTCSDTDDAFDRA